MVRQIVAVRRVYDAVSPTDGVRVLVDRLWPRGLSREAVRLDDWAKDVAPSTELRRWYAHDPTKFEGFRARYRRELDEAPARAAFDRLRALADAGPLTLLTAAADVPHSQAWVLSELLRDVPPDRSRSSGATPEADGTR